MVWLSVSSGATALSLATSRFNPLASFCRDTRSHPGSRLTEAASASFRDNFPNQPVYACKSACAACCHLFVAVPPGIAEAIAAHIERAFSPAERTALMTRLNEAAAAAAEAQDPARLRRRCPLLGEDNRCSVHEVRPLPCRALTSTSVSRCQKIVFDPTFATAGVDHRIHMEATAALQETALVAACLPTKRAWRVRCWASSQNFHRYRASRQGADRYRQECNIVEDRCWREKSWPRDS